MLNSGDQNRVIHPWGSEPVLNLKAVQTVKGAACCVPIIVEITSSFCINPIFDPHPYLHSLNLRSQSLRS
jgi:hypothetical protein